MTSAKLPYQGLTQRALRLPLLAGSALALLLTTPARPADIVFTGTQTASGNIVINSPDRALFFDQSSGGTANILVNSPLYFYDSSTAGQATITNSNFISNIVFYNNSTAGNATINNGYALSFTGNSNAGSASIAHTGNFLVFGDNSSAANASIDARYFTTFREYATGGNAAIANSSGIQFYHNSTAGNAALSNTLATAFVDFSGSAGPNGDGRLRAGSIAGTGEFRLGNRELTVGGNNQSTTVTGSITGAGGALVKVGTGTLTLSGTNTYTGTTTVQSGGLVVSGSLASSAVTVNGGILSGTGTLGGLIANSGGTVAPGNSIGTLTVAGNVAFAPGSTYRAEVNAAGQGDRIVASGSASLTGGTVQVLAANGDYADATSYTILTASGGVTGEFSSATSNLAFLTPYLTYSAQEVTLTMSRNGVSFASLAHTPNQAGIARAIEALGPRNPVYATLVSATANEARAGFTQLAGEAHAQAATVALGASRMVADTLLGRLRGTLLTMPGSPVAAAFSADLPGRKDAITLPAPLPAPRFALWGEGFGMAGHVDGNANAGSLATRGGGFLLGAEMLLVESTAGSFRLGAAGGYSATQFDVDSRLSNGRLESGHGALYAGARFGQLRLDAGLAYAFGETTLTRRIAIRGFSDLLRSQRDTDTAQLFAELGYGFAWQGFAIEPFAQLALLRISQGSATEQGGAAALRLHSGDQNLGFTTLGLRAEAQLGTLPLFARGLLGWRYGFGDLTPRALTSFIVGTMPARVFAASIDRNALVAEAGIDWRISPSTKLGLIYSASLGENTRDHALKGQLEVRF